MCFKWQLEHIHMLPQSRYNSGGALTDLLATSPETWLVQDNAIQPHIPVANFFQHKEIHGPHYITSELSTTEDQANIMTCFIHNRHTHPNAIEWAQVHCGHWFEDCITYELSLLAWQLTGLLTFNHSHSHSHLRHIGYVKGPNAVVFCWIYIRNPLPPPPPPPTHTHGPYLHGNGSQWNQEYTRTCVYLLHPHTLHRFDRSEQCSHQYLDTKGWIHTKTS